MIFPLPHGLFHPLRTLPLWISGSPTSRLRIRALGRPFRAWALYRLRIIVDADLCADWPPCGGLAHQLNNLSIILHLATTESISVALAYDSIPPAHLEELARARANRTAGAVDFMDLLSSERQRFMLHAIAQAAKSVLRPL